MAEKQYPGYKVRYPGEGLYKYLLTIILNSQKCIHYLYIKEKPMKASIVDLRYKMKKILKALERNEQVTIVYHGKEKGIIKSVRSTKEIRIINHPFFGMNTGDDSKTVEDIMNELRGKRY